MYLACCTADAMVF